jgi:hypothetical protein
MIRRLNFKLIVLFFIALWLFDKAGEILGYLRNPTLAEQIRHAKGDTSALKSEGLTVISITDLMLASGFASLIGLLVGLIISLIICRGHKWHWLNSVLALVIVYMTGWLQIDSTSYIVRLLRMPGEIFNGIWYYLINGLVSVSLGLLTFMFMSLLKDSNNNHRVTVKPQSA